MTRAASDAHVALNWRMHLTSFDAACAMVAAGLGAAVVPRAATTPYIRSLNLISVPLAEPWSRRQLFLCARANAPLHATAKLFFDHLLAHS
jgi:DNA-binding transcriptional LysR family regulator